MKKNNLFLGILLVTLIGLVFTACTEDEKAGPTITFAGGNYIDADATVAPGAAIAFSWTAQKGDGNLATITIDRDGVALTGWDELDIDNSVNDIYIDEAQFTAPLNEGSYVYTITVTDKNDLSVSEQFTITVEGGGDPIDEFSAILMGAQSNTTLGSYLDVSEGASGVMKQAAASSSQGSIDIVYYYGSTNTATLTAPDDETVGGGAGNLSLCEGWTTKNATRFASSTLSASEFDDVEDDAPIAGLTGLSASKMTALSVGDVIAFETVDGKKGLIKVAALEATSSGTITIDVKIQQ
jgi:hypothetical protein